MKNATVIMLVVCLAMAAPTFGSVDIDSTWTVDAAWGLGYTTDARFGSSSSASGTVNIVAGGTWNTDGEMRFAENGVAATINVQVGGTLNAEVEMQWNEGDVGTQQNRLNVYGTAFVEQLKMYGRAGDDITTVGNGTDAATLTVTESLLGNSGVASITINAGSTMLVAGDWDWAFEIGANGTVALADGGVLKVNAIDVHFATSANEAKVTGDWVKTYDAGAFGGDGANVYTGVPEPATMSLLALGGFGLLIRRRRRA